MAELAWIATARSFIGIKEVKGKEHNPKILEMWKAIKRGGIKDDETPWCAAFVGACLEWVKIQSSRFESAASYLTWGVTCKVIYGAIAVISRDGGSGYHVGFIVGKDGAGNVMILGGNQSDEVNIRAFKPERIKATRWPSVIPIEDRGMPILSKSELSSGES